MFSAANDHNRLSGFRGVLPCGTRSPKPLNRLSLRRPDNTRLKPGANEIGTKLTDSPRSVLCSLALVTWTFLVSLSFALGASPPTGSGPEISVPLDSPSAPARPLPKSNWIDQSPEEALLKSRGCLECHAGTDTHTMHRSRNVVLGCTDCHGGNPGAGLTMRKAHVPPVHPEFWQSSANPNDSTVLLNHESPEFIQFVNPGDLRVAGKACGLCHAKEVKDVGHSMMRHGAMLWGAALYNNGATPQKNPRYGQAYAPDGTALR